MKPQSMHHFGLYYQRQCHYFDSHSNAFRSKCDCQRGIDKSCLQELGMILACPKTNVVISHTFSINADSLLLSCHASDASGKGPEGLKTSTKLTCCSGPTISKTNLQSNMWCAFSVGMLAIHENKSSKQSWCTPRERRIRAPVSWCRRTSCKSLNRCKSLKRRPR
jgi:hypothetical protein